MILHIASRDEWRQAQVAGEIAPASLADEGFVHCSDFGTAHLAANAHFAGRTDLLLLVIDPAALPVRWEPGRPPSANGAWFPHVYGPIPTGAVVATHEFPPTADGTFRLPARLAAT